jgi:glycosyltransferase involved in cell wall biosynthesis
MHHLDCTAVIPAHNEARYIGGAIQSVLRQTVPPKSILVVNDGFADGTGEFAARYQGVTVKRPLASGSRSEAAETPDGNP